MITNRQTYIEYCMRRLGYPVVRINLDAEQAEDCVDDALTYFKSYHKDGMEYEVLKVEVTQEMVDANAIPMPSYVGAVLRCVPYRGEFENAVVSAPGAIGVFPFFPAPPVVLNSPTNSVNFSVTGYAAYQVTNEAYKYLFKTERDVTWRRASRTVTFNADTTLKVGDVFLFEIYSEINFEDSKTIWNDIWLKEYGVALMRIQWGTNLSKFGGVQLPTGITLNGQDILDRGIAERDALLTRLHEEFAEPINFFMA